MSETEVERLTGERDRARDVAVKLEQECAHLVEVIAEQDADITELRDDVARSDAAAFEAGERTPEETAVLLAARGLAAVDLGPAAPHLAAEVALRRAVVTYARSVALGGER